MDDIDGVRVLIGPQQPGPGVPNAPRRTPCDTDIVSVSCRGMTTLTERSSPPRSLPDGVNPLRARRALRDLYAHPSLSAADLTAPLLVLPDDAPPATLPGAVQLAAVRPTVERWAALGIRG